MQLPAPDAEILSRRSQILSDLSAILAVDCIITDPDGLSVYETDGLSAHRQRPLAVVLPKTTAEVSNVLSYCHASGVKIVPRGAGTGVSGGALPLADGVLLGLGKLNRILDIDLANRCVVAQPGVTNLAITQAVEKEGFFYAPDPSSQLACSIGGNVAENAGGIHCLKYGMTTNNLLGLEVVLMDGQIVRVGGRHMDAPGYDFLGIFTGSEGLLGVITEVTLRVLPKPSSVRAMVLGFPSHKSAGDCVGAIIAAGILPAALELMDKGAVAATEAFVASGYPTDAEAVLIAELDGTAAEVDDLLARVASIARGFDAVVAGFSESEADRKRLWAGRKSTFGAVGRLAPDCYALDGSIPRARLAEVFLRTGELAKVHGLRVVNVFHAGDGNHHPLILFDANTPGDLEKAEALGADILKLTVAVGGALSGEHGIGIEKRDLMGLMFSEIDLDQQQRVKCVFDPKSLLNPGKMFPILHRCAELGKLHMRGDKRPFPDLPRY
ncbi:FAD-binding protein [Rhodospirillaceae bacterium AH-315-P19]|nr:FAD-binding protein [Rhodospirillaceae bacterium AH-315-P19]